MASIYKNGAITIAAVNAVDCTKGLFSTSSSKFSGMEPVQGDSANESPQTDKIFVRKRLHHVYRDTGDPSEMQFDIDPTKLPLAKRAWFYQERLLSRRMLLFGANEISWECRESLDCECANSKTIHLLKKDAHHYKLSLSDSNSDNINRVWASIVRIYSRLDLSFPTDILPALSGIASRFQPFKKGRYLAGLWEDSLLINLAWRKDDVLDPVPRPSPWRGPTWSWISTTGGCRCDNFPGDKTMSQMMSILNIDYVLKDSNVFGEITSATLTVSGPLIKLDLVRSPVEDYYAFKSTRGGFRSFLPDHNLYVPYGQSLLVYAIRLFCLNKEAITLILLYKSADIFERIGSQQFNNDFDDCCGLFTPETIRTIILI